MSKETQVFTPDWVTNNMLDLLDERVFSDDSTYFFEPSCGDGRMLIQVLDRVYKHLLLKHDGDKLKALSETCFRYRAIEIDGDLVKDARVNVFQWVFSKLDEGDDYFTLCQYLIANSVRDKIEVKDFFKMFNVNESK